MSEQILVVDDEELVRQALRHVLEPEGYLVVEAPHGGIAMEILAQTADRPRYFGSPDAGARGSWRPF